MFNNWQLKRAIKYIAKKHEAELKQYHDDGNEEKANALLEKMENQVDAWDSQMQESESMRLFYRAQKYDLEVPYPNEEMWEKDDRFRILTAKGRLAIRKAIDEEISRRRELTGWWWKTVIIPGLTAITGTVGAITGLIAVLHRK
jgi:hypothetical protein